MQARGDLRDVMKGTVNVMNFYTEEIIRENARDVAGVGNNRRRTPESLVELLPGMLASDREMMLIYILAGALIYAGIGNSLCPPDRPLYMTWLRTVAGPLFADLFIGIGSMQDLSIGLKTSYLEWFGSE